MNKGTHILAPVISKNCLLYCGMATSLENGDMVPRSYRTFPAPTSVPTPKSPLCAHTMTIRATTDALIYNMYMNTCRTLSYSGTSDMRNDDPPRLGTKTIDHRADHNELI